MNKWVAISLGTVVLCILCWVITIVVGLLWQVRAWDIFSLCFQIAIAIIAIIISIIIAATVAHAKKATTLANNADVLLHFIESIGNGKIISQLFRAIQQAIQKQKRVSISFVVLFSLLVIFAGSSLYQFDNPRIVTRIVKVTLTPPSVSCGLCIEQASDGETIGITDGNQRLPGHATPFSFWFDTDDKKKIDQDARSNNAEKLITAENNDIIKNYKSSPRIIVVVPVGFTHDDSGAYIGGQYNTQGAYVAQKQFNDNCYQRKGDSRCWKMLVYLANLGTNSQYAVQIAQQIQYLAYKEKPDTFVAIMGFSTSTPTAINAIHLLTNGDSTHSPLLVVSPSASSDALSGISTPGAGSFFYRVAPPDKDQALMDVQYAENILHVKNVVVFFDPTLPYSVTLSADIHDDLARDGIPVQRVAYTQKTEQTQSNSTLEDALPDVEKQHPDLLFFAGHARDLDDLLSRLDAGQYPNLRNAYLMGGDALYKPGQSDNYGNHHLYFTVFAFPDADPIEQNDPDQTLSKFNKDYKADFQSTYASGYGYSRADSDAILAYDGVKAYIQGLKILFNSGVEPTSNTMQLVFAGTRNQHSNRLLSSFSYWGASGLITFGPDGNPVAKDIIIVYANCGYNTFLGIAGRVSSDYQPEPVGASCPVQKSV